MARANVRNSIISCSDTGVHVQGPADSIDLGKADADGTIPSELDAKAVHEMSRNIFEDRQYSSRNPALLFLLARSLRAASRNA